MPNPFAWPPKYWAPYATKPKPRGDEATRGGSKAKADEEEAEEEEADEEEAEEESSDSASSDSADEEERRRRDLAADLKKGKRRPKPKAKGKGKA